MSIIEMEMDKDLLWACKWGDINEVRVLLDAGASIDACDSDGNTALMKAIIREQRKKVEEKKSVLLDDYVQIVTMLIESGIDCNKQNVCGSTALKWASWFGYDEIVKMLINAGADVNLSDKYGNTPLSMALSAPFEYPAVIYLLTEAGAHYESKEPIALKDTTLNREQKRYNTMLSKVITSLSRASDDDFQGILDEIGNLFLNYFQFHLDEARECAFRNKKILKNKFHEIYFFDYIGKKLSQLNSWNDDYYPIYFAKTTIEAFNSMFGEVVGCLDLYYDDRLYGQVYSKEMPQFTPRSHWWWWSYLDQ